MSKTYEPQDLIKALEMSGAQTVGNISIDNARDALLLMGLDVQPEKPEPGTIGITCDGLAAYVDDGGVWRVILANGGWRNANDTDALTPARVVAASERLISEAPGWEQDLLTGAMRKTPAVPFELSKAEVGALYDSARLADPDRTARAMAPAWSAFGEFAKDYFTGALNAAIAKHGHGRVEVSREEVLAVVKKGIYETPWSEDRNEAITSAIMELLEGSK